MNKKQQDKIFDKVNTSVLKMFMKKSAINIYTQREKVSIDIESFFWNKLGNSLINIKDQLLIIE